MTPGSDRPNGTGPDGGEGTRGIRGLNLWMRAFLYGTFVLFVVNGIQLLVLYGDTATYFAWTVPPLGAATLGAAYFALAAGQFVAARQRTWAAARVAVPWLFVFSASAVILAFVNPGEAHFSSSDATARFMAWFWVASYAVVILAGIPAVLLQLRAPGADPPRSRPLPHSMRTAFRVQALLLMVPGVMFALIPRVFFSGWVYPPTALSLEATGVGFFAIGVIALHSSRENDLSRVRPTGGLYTVFAVLELAVVGSSATAIDWTQPLTWTLMVLLVSLLAPGTQALVGRPVLTLRRSKVPADPGLLNGGAMTAHPGLEILPSLGDTEEGTAGSTTMHGPALGERPWFRLWPSDVPRSIDYPEVSVGELMHRAARRYPDRVAIRFFGTPMTYRECEAAMDRFAAGLRRIGVRKGDRVSVMLLMSPHFPIVLGGLLQAGCVVVQTSPLYTPDELVRMYNDAGVETVVAIDIAWPTVEKVKPRTKVSRVVVCDLADFMKTPVRQVYASRKRKNLKKAGHWPLRIPDEPWVHRFPDLAATPPDTVKAVAVSPEDLAVLQYTGGTTGIPKAAMLTHRNLVAGALQGAVWIARGAEHDRVASSSVPFHVSGLIGGLQFWVRGDENLLAPDPRDFRHILKLIEKNRATFLAGPPTMYNAMLHRPDFAKYDLSSLRMGYATSAPLPREVRSEFERLTGCRVVSMYGLSEACPAIGNTWDGPEREGIGIPQSDTDARVVDAQDPKRVLEAGEVGELVIRGPQVMKGYWNHPEETAQTLREGWLLTGDLVRMDTDGYFTIVDRKKDMINASGYKVYPVEVEDVLFTHPGIAEAAVIGVPDAYRGETVKAFIVRKPGTEITEADVSAFCKEHLAAYKVPKLIEFVPDLPKTLVGKVLHRELREREKAKAAG